MDILHRPLSAPSPPLTSNSRDLIGYVVRGSRVVDTITVAEERKNEGKGRWKGQISRARVSPARKSWRVRKRERVAEEEDIEVRRGGLLLLLGSPPTTWPAAATPVRSQSALDRRPLDFAIHKRR